MPQGLPLKSVGGRSRSLIIPVRHRRAPACHGRVNGMRGSLRPVPSSRRPVRRSTARGIVPVTPRIRLSRCVKGGIGTPLIYQEICLRVCMGRQKNSLIIFLSSCNPRSMLSHTAAFPTPSAWAISVLLNPRK